MGLCVRVHVRNTRHVSVSVCFVEKYKSVCMCTCMSAKVHPYFCAIQVITDSIENATTPKSTKSRNSIPRYKFKSNQYLNFNLHREMSRNLCLDLVDFGGVAIPVENVICVLCVNVYVYTCVNLYLCVYADYVRVKTACVCESKCAYLA